MDYNENDPQAAPDKVSVRLGALSDQLRAHLLTMANAAVRALSPFAGAIATSIYTTHYALLEAHITIQPIAGDAHRTTIRVRRPQRRKMCGLNRANNRTMLVCTCARSPPKG